MIAARLANLPNGARLAKSPSSIDGGGSKVTRVEAAKRLNVGPASVDRAKKAGFDALRMQYSAPQAVAGSYTLRTPRQACRTIPPSLASGGVFYGLDHPQDWEQFGNKQKFLAEKLTIKFSITTWKSIGARDRTRTYTRLLSLEPESSASTNSATRAQ